MEEKSIVFKPFYLIYRNMYPKKVFSTNLVWKANNKSH